MNDLIKTECCVFSLYFPDKGNVNALNLKVSRQTTDNFRLSLLDAKTLLWWTKDGQQHAEHQAQKCHRDNAPRHTFSFCLFYLKVINIHVHKHLFL